MPISVLQEQMTSSEFTDWIAYYRLEPWGYEAENWRAAMVAWAFAKMHGAKSAQIEDFLPVRRQPEQSVAETIKQWSEAIRAGR